MIITFSNELVLNILKYIENNLYTQITISNLVNDFHYNKDYMMRLFKREIGVTIFEYINKKRIYHSLFSYSSNNSITKISILFGFSSLEYYSEIFKKYMGVSPNKYRLYVMIGKKVSLEDITIIRSHIASLNSFIHKVDDYQKNILSPMPYKSLSIFKK